MGFQEHVWPDLPTLAGHLRCVPRVDRIVRLTLKKEGAVVRVRIAHLFQLWFVTLLNCASIIISCFVMHLTVIDPRSALPTMAMPCVLQTPSHLCRRRRQPAYRLRLHCQSRANFVQILFHLRRFMVMSHSRQATR